jgi:hypothetical protein
MKILEAKSYDQMCVLHDLLILYLHMFVAANYCLLIKR